MWDPAATWPGLLLAVSIFAPWALAALTLGLRRRSWAWVPSFVLLVLETVLLFLLWSHPAEVSFHLPWVGAPEVALSLRLDALARVVAPIVCIIGAAVVLFAGTYLPHDLRERKSPRTEGAFHALILFFVGSMLGLVCADDLLLFYVFWEGTTVASALLVAYHAQEDASRDAGLHAMVLTGCTSLALFVALVCLAFGGGTSSIAALGADPSWLVGSPLALPVALGLVGAALAKSAQFPLHGWLPAAMIAPTPVSALLHSATVVAAGVFLLARFLPVLAALPGLQDTLVLLGFVSLLTGGLVALRRQGLKDVLAWSTISQYGYVTILLGLGAQAAALYVIAHHAVAKAGLFLCAGTIAYGTGKDDLHDLGGLARMYPWASAVVAVLALGLAGLPMTAGFWMKEIFFHDVEQADWNWVLGASVAGSALTVAYLVRVAWMLLFSESRIDEAAPEGSLWPMLLPAGALASWLLLSGTFPSLGAALANPSPLPPIPLRLSWPPSPSLYASLVSVALGVGLFTWLRLGQRGGGPDRSVRSPTVVLEAVARVSGPTNLYRWTMALLDRSARALGRLQTGRLTHYLAILALVLPVLGLALLGRWRSWPPLPSTRSFDSTFVAALALAGAVGALAVGSVWVRSHVSAILMVGGVGYALALLFTILRAPDIALVQMVVETATALLLLAALSRIPLRLRHQVLGGEREHRGGPRAVLVGIAVACGAVSFASVLGLAQLRADPTLGRSYLALSEQEGIDAAVKGILVDFRATDTLVEVSVFAAATLGSVLLLGRPKARRPAGRRDGP